MFSRRQPLYRRAREISRRAQEWLEGNADSSFFLFLNYLDAHDPYLPIAEDDERFAQRPAGDEWLAFPTARYDSAVPGEATFAPHELAFLEAQYDAGLVSLDREFARLIAHLKESGLFENTLIIVTGDHGESFFEHGFLEHGNTLYQEEVGGFLLIKPPASVKAVKPSPLMQFVDFFPTVAEVLGEPVPPGLQGSPWGHGRDYALAELFCELCGSDVDAQHRKWPAEYRRELVSILIGDQKIIYSSDGTTETYRLATDPLETQPLTDPDPQFLRRAGEIIAERNKHMVEGLSKRPEDNILLEKLRSLGYIQ
jgi:arylsulfatase A-like enzyme